MIKPQIINIIKAKFNEYFKYVRWYCIHTLNMDGKNVFTPTNLVISEVGQHIVLDFFGATNSNALLSVHAGHHFKTSNFFTYFTHLSEKELSGVILDQVLNISDSNGISLLGGAILCNTNREDLEIKYPLAAKYIFDSKIARFGENTAKGIKIPLNCDSNSDEIILSNVYTAYNYNNQVRLKHILLMLIYKNNQNLDYYEKTIGNSLTPKINHHALGTVCLSNDYRDKNFFIASQFCSLYSLPSVSEQTIQQYIENNQSIIVKSLGYNDFLAQPKLYWIEGNETENECIIPDLLLRRADGTFDILDLKLPLNETSTITVGKSNRKRFCTKVTDGIAQLAMYEKYFLYEKNREYARQKYNIILSPDPKLYLIIGRQENYFRNEVDLALLPYKDRIIVLDYDTIYANFLLN